MTSRKISGKEKSSSGISLLANKKFQRYKIETMKPMRAAKVSDAILKQFAEIFRQLEIKDYFKSDESNVDIYYPFAVEAVKNLSYTAREVEEFSKRIDALAGSKFFLYSAGDSDKSVTPSSFWIFSRVS